MTLISRPGQVQDDGGGGGGPKSVGAPAQENPLVVFSGGIPPPQSSAGGPQRVGLVAVARNMLTGACYVDRRLLCWPAVAILTDRSDHSPVRLRQEEKVSGTDMRGNYSSKI